VIEVWILRLLWAAAHEPATRNGFDTGAVRATGAYAIATYLNARGRDVCRRPS
jgi:hypothetical protein